MVMLNMLKDFWDVGQPSSLQTDETQSSQMEQFTVMLQYASDWLELKTDILMKGLGMFSAIPTKKQINALS